MEIGAAKVCIMRKKRMTRMTHRSISRSAAFAAGLCLLVGCGYRFAGTGNRLPPEIHTISFGTMQNTTREVGIEKQLVEALEDEVAGHGRLEIASVGSGDAVLTGLVRDYASRPVAFSARDEARAELAVDLHDDGHVLLDERVLVGLRPALAVQTRGVAECLPQLRTDVRDDRSE